MGGLAGQGLACHAMAVFIKLFFLQECSKSQRDAGVPLRLKPLPGMCLERRIHLLGPGTSSDCGAEQYGEHLAEDNGTVEVFSPHDPISEQAKQDTKRIPNATKYQVLTFNFPILLA